MRRSGSHTRWFLRAGGGFRSRIHGSVGFDWRLSHKDNVPQVGFGVEGGWFHLGVSMPFSWPVGPRDSVVYTRPAVGLNSLGIDRLPVGYAWQVGRHDILQTEVALHALGYYTPTTAVFTLAYTHRY